MFNPVTAMMLTSSKLRSGISTCEIKGDFLPDIIYMSLSATKLGNEDVILADGSFLKFYGNVLID